MQYLFSLLTILITFSNLSAQNLVPNSSFEELNKASASWMLNHELFESRIKDWTTPNLGSPDIFSNKLVEKIRPPRKGVVLKSHQARTGEVMVGIKTYGCATYTQHCKEYIQIELKERVQNKQSYYIEFWVNPMSTSLNVNNIGLAFADVEIQDDSEYGIHYLDPVVNHKELITQAPNDWLKISGTIESDGNYTHIIIGNFYTDSETNTLAKDESIAYSYYFVDDVMVSPVDAKVTELTDLKIEVGNTITLNQIQFESNNAVLLPASFNQLEELVKILNANEDMQIQVNGHTDNKGTEAANLLLSENRASKVVAYLIEKGISVERLKSKGFGESAPVADNDSAEGRQLNRRVEFIILDN